MFKIYYGLPHYVRRSPGWELQNNKSDGLRPYKAKNKRPLLNKLKRPSFFCFTPLGLAFIVLAVRGGFEPPEPLRVRQFSKLLVSATHPPHQKPAPERRECKDNNSFLSARPTSEVWRCSRAFLCRPEYYGIYNSPLYLNSLP